MSAMTVAANSEVLRITEGEPTPTSREFPVGRIGRRGSNANVKAWALTHRPAYPRREVTGERADRGHAGALVGRVQ